MKKNHKLFVKELKKWNKLEYERDLAALRKNTKLSDMKKDEEERRIASRR